MKSIANIAISEIISINCLHKIKIVNIKINKKNNHLKINKNKIIINYFFIT